MNLSSKSDCIVIPNYLRSNEPVFIQARHGQKIIAEPGARIEINSDVRGIDGGHPLQISGLRGSLPKMCRIGLDLNGLYVEVKGRGRIFDDAISLISVQGTRQSPMRINDCDIIGVLEAGDEADTAICLDRATDWFEVINNRIDIFSGNSAIVSAGGGRGLIENNVINGTSVAKSQDRSAIACYNHYKKDAMRGPVRVFFNHISWEGGPPVWNDTTRAWKAFKKSKQKAKLARAS